MKNLNLFLKCLIIIQCALTFRCSNEVAKNSKITVGYLPIIAHLPALVAREQGYFKNLSIDFQVFSSSNDLLSSLSKGDVDIATTLAVAPVAQLTSILMKDKKKSAIRFFSYSKTSSDEPFDAVFVNGDSKVSDICSINGKKVGVFPGTTAKNICGYFIEKKCKLNPNEIEWIGLPPNLQLDALRSGNIDVLYTYEPTCTSARLNNFKQIYGSVIAGVLEGAPYGGSAINRKFENDNPELSRQFIEAFDRAINTIRQNPILGRNILKNQLNLSTDIAQNCNIEYRFTSDEIIQQNNIERFQQFLEILFNMKEISEKVNAELLIK